MPKTKKSEGSQDQEEQEDTLSYNYKICFVGDIKSGKTSVIHRLTANSFSSQYKGTIDVDFVLKTMKKEQRLQIWDIAGQEQFGTMVRTYFNATNCFVVCFDTSTKNFNKEKNIFVQWLSSINNNFSEDFALVVLGTKRDLIPDLDEEKFKNAIKEIINNHDISQNPKIKFNPAKNIVITSAKDGTNCQELPKIIVDAINFQPQQQTLPLPSWAETLRSEIARFEFSSWGKSTVKFKYNDEQSDLISKKITKTAESAWKILLDYTKPSSKGEPVKAPDESSLLSQIKETFQKQSFSFTRADSSRIFYGAWSDPKSAALAKETLEKIINTFNFDEKKIHGLNFFKHKVRMQIGTDPRITTHVLPNTATNIVNLYLQAKHYEITWQEAIAKAEILLHKNYYPDDLRQKPARRDTKTQTIYNQAFETIQTNYNYNSDKWPENHTKKLDKILNSQDEIKTFLTLQNSTILKSDAEKLAEEILALKDINDKKRMFIAAIYYQCYQLFQNMQGKRGFFGNHESYFKPMIVIYNAIKGSDIEYNPNAKPADQNSFKNAMKIMHEVETWMKDNKEILENHITYVENNILSKTLNSKSL